MTKIIKLSQKKLTFDTDSNTYTVWVDEDTALKISAADVLAMSGKIIDSTCRASKIPPRVINHIEGQIENVKGFVADAEKENEKSNKIDLPKIQKIKKETGQRLSKPRKSSLLSFIRQYLNSDSERFNNNEIQSLIGRVPIHRVVLFLEDEGYTVKTTKTTITVSKM